LFVLLVASEWGAVESGGSAVADGSVANSQCSDNAVAAYASPLPIPYFEAIQDTIKQDMDKAGIETSFTDANLDQSKQQGEKRVDVDFSAS
jgi:hypothetical protein